MWVKIYTILDKWVWEKALQWRGISLIKITVCYEESNTKFSSCLQVLRETLWSPRGERKDTRPLPRYKANNFVLMYHWSLPPMFFFNIYFTPSLVFHVQVNHLFHPYCKLKQSLYTSICFPKAVSKSSWIKFSYFCLQGMVLELMGGGRKEESSLSPVKQVIMFPISPSIY